MMCLAMYEYTITAPCAANWQPSFYLYLHD